MKTIEEIVALNVKQLRKKRGWSQTELADRAKISLQTVNRLEKMTQATRPSNLAAIAEALGTSKEELMLDPDALEPKQAPSAAKIAQLLAESEARLEALEAENQSLKAQLSSLPEGLLERLIGASDTEIQAVMAALRMRKKKKASDVV